jgi:hypothetical protein
VEARLADPASYSGPDAHRELGRQHAAIQAETERLEARWLELGTELEAG